MKKESVKNLATVIKANTERRTLGELAAEGKRHVRVVSGAKVMKIIEGIVEDTIRREAGQMAEADRDRIVSETKGRFDRVMRLQNEQDDIIQMQKDLLDEQKAEIHASELRVGSLTDELEAAREELVHKEGRLLGEHQDRIVRLEEEKRDLSGRLRNLDDERGKLIEALSRQRRRLLEVETEKNTVGEDVEEAHSSVVKAEERVRRLEERLENERAQFESASLEMDRLRQELVAQREHAAEREARLVSSHQDEIVRLHGHQKDLVGRIEGERGELAGRQENVLADAQQKVKEMKALCGDLQSETEDADRKREDAERDLARTRARLAASGTKIDVLKKEVARLNDELGHARDQASSHEQELTSGREQAAVRSVAELQKEVQQLNALVKNFAEKPSGPGDEVIERLVNTIGDQKSEIADRFDNQMEKTLDEVTRALRKATANPIDDVVEATDVLVARVFDDDSEMKSNLDDLTIEEHTSSGGGISSNLEQLRQAMQGGSSEEQAED